MPRLFLVRVTVPAGVLLLLTCFANSPVGAQTRSAASAHAARFVPDGPRFLVRLEQELNTGKDRLNQKFEVKTIEPLQDSSGYVIRPGARIFGHISRIESAGLTGRARVWLTFDDIETRRGIFPIVAEVASVPDEFSVRTGESREGEIEARSSTGTRVAESTAEGAAMGSAHGITDRNRKEAAMGAAAGGVAGFLASSGIGQEIDLPKGAKLELVLNRPLYLNH